MKRSLAIGILASLASVSVVAADTQYQEDRRYSNQPMVQDQRVRDTQSSRDRENRAFTDQDQDRQRNFVTRPDRGYYQQDGYYPNQGQYNSESYCPRGEGYYGQEAYWNEPRDEYRQDMDRQDLREHQMRRADGQMDRYDNAQPRYQR